MSSASNSALIEHELRNDVLVLRFCVSEVRTPEVSFAIRDEVLAAVDASGTSKFVVDLSRVEFMSSVGLLTLMSLRRHVENAKIVLTGLWGHVLDVMETCRLVNSEHNTNGVFEVAESIDQAVEILDQHAP